ncbi:flagellar hook-associated protein FlgK [Candidatus Poribacteria bacterium]|nr:flagellar hook-associated protein FlgK [Candidatus Poribacteria bacterium]
MSTLLNSLGLLNSLNTGRRAVNAQQAALQITGRNISNVNTPGYTRQRAVTQVSDPRTEVLLGEDRTRVQQVRDELVERLFLQERQRFASLDKSAQLLSQVETALGEPSDSALNAQLSRFYDAWESLATSPESAPPKNVVIERARTLSATFGSLTRHLESLQQQNLTDAADLIKSVNLKLGQIRALNEQISQEFTVGGDHLELRDRQDEIIRELADLVAVRVTEGVNGMRTVQANGLALVEGHEAGSVQLVTGQNGRFTVQAVLDGSRFDLTPMGGELHGLMTVQNEALPAILNDLHSTARTLISQVNALHPNFFRTLTTEQSARAALFVEILPTSPSDVRATASGRAGANEIALSVAGLRNARQTDLADQSVIGFYQELVSAVGARVQEAGERRDTSNLLVEQMRQRRESVSGVSLDEEATDMITYQRAFQAAARYIQVVDDLMRTIIERV